MTRATSDASHQLSRFPPSRPTLHSEKLSIRSLFPDSAVKNTQKMNSGSLANAAHATTVSLLPEPLIGDLEPYLVHSHIDILANLRRLIDQHALVSVYFDQGASFIVTRLLGVNPEFEELIFDLSPDERTNEKLLASSSLTMVAFLNHIKVQFTVNHAELTQFQGGPAFRARSPRSILRLQRRTAFRARTPMARSPYVLLSPTPDKSGKSDTSRLRVAEISATGFAFVASKGRPVLTAGLRLPGCLLELQAGESFDVDIDIRHVLMFKDGFGRGMCRAGCRLLNMSGSTEMAIQRHVNQLAAARLQNP